MKNKFLYMWKLPFLWGMGNRLIQIKERANIPLIIYVTWNCMLKTVDIRSPKTVISVHFSYSLPMAMQIY